MSESPSFRSKSLLEVATEHPELSIPLFAGGVSLVFVAGLAKHITSEFVHYRGFPPGGMALELVMFLFDSGILLVCLLVLRSTIRQKGWAGTLELLRQIFFELPLMDRAVVAMIAVSVISAVFTFLLV